MPTIEVGGVEKNLIILANYLINKINEVSIITISKKYKSKFNKKITKKCQEFSFLLIRTLSTFYARHVFILVILFL